MEHFAIVEKLCRAALTHSGNAPEVHRHVAHLKNVLGREAKTRSSGSGPRGAHGGGGSADAGDGENGLQAITLERLLVRFRAARVATAGDAPTPQTRARLRQDSVRHMLRRGTLQREHADAADEIRNVFEAVTSGLFPRARRLDPAEVLVGLERRGFRQPLERLPERLGVLWRRRYKPWAEAVSAVEVGRSNLVSYSAFQLTIAVLVDGRSLAEIDRELGLRRGTAAAYFRGALNRYATNAGWIRPRLEVREGEAVAGAGEGSERGSRRPASGGESRGRAKAGADGCPGAGVTGASVATRGGAGEARGGNGAKADDGGAGNGGVARVGAPAEDGGATAANRSREGSRPRPRRLDAWCGCGARFTHPVHDSVVACPRCGQTRAYHAATHG